MTSSAKAAKKYADKVLEDIRKFIQRQRGDMTYTEFAKRTGFDRRRLARWEKGHLKRLGVDDLEVLVKRLNCRIWDVFPDERPPRRRHKS